MEFDSNNLVVAGGLVVGAVLGATIQRSNYCLMGAVADYAISGRLLRMRAWMLTIAVAVLACQGLHLAGVVDLSASFYRGPVLAWLALPLGGLLFGFGMVIACGCSSRSLVNFACGDLRALIALLFMGVFGYATMRGLLAYPRLWLEQAATLDTTRIGLAGQGLPEVLAGTESAGAAATLGASLLVAAPLLWFALADAAFRRERALLSGSLIIGLTVAAGWLVTGVLGADDFEPAPLVSLRFVAPVGETLQYLMVFTGSRADFGIATVAGVIAGAGLMALARGEFAWRAFEDLHDLRRYTLGGALMGVGGVLSLGCTVGQGLSGVSTLSLGSFVALAGIITGGIVGVRYLEQGSLLGAVRATFGRV